MSILGVGLWEIIIILIIALVVAGPRRMIQWAYLTGRFFAQLRVMWDQAMASMQKEFDDAGVDFKLPKDPTNRAEMRRFTQDALRPLREPMEQAMRDYEQERQQIKGEIEAGIKADGTPSDDDTPADSGETPTVPQQLPPPDNANGGQQPPKRPNDFGTWSRGG